jgi:rhodanese-related sulfurtransferase/DNA-binding HxlR family transcriptional regulator
VTTTRRDAKDALYDGLTRIARALGSGRRAEIVDVLAQGERTVEQLGEEIGQSLANTSHHLRTLARAGLVTSRRDGTHIHYSLASDDVLDAWWALRRVAARTQPDVDDLATAYLGDPAQVDRITRDQLAARLATGEVTLIDVRPAEEYAAGHLPGAISVPPDRLGELLDMLPTGQEVVAYCRGPYCAYADDAVRRLIQMGRRAVRLDEGLPEWRAAGGPVDR